MRVYCFVMWFVTVFLFGAATARAQTAVPTPAPQAAAYSESRAYEPRVLPTQENKKKDKKPIKDDKSDGRASTPGATLGAGVQVKPLSIPLSVFDETGNVVTGLKASEFKVFINDQEQQIDSVTVAEEPLNIVLLFDTSASTEYRLEEMQQRGLDLVNKLAPYDRVMVASFNERLDVLSDLTANRAATTKAISKLKFGDGTSIYDTMDELFRKQLATIPGRKAVIIFTDGVDTTSRRAKYETSLLEVEKADAEVFPVYWDTAQDVPKGRTLNPQNLPPALRQIMMPDGLPVPLYRGKAGNTKEEQVMGRSYLDDLINLSGGRAVTKEVVRQGVVGSASDIPQELHSQYVLTLAPSAAQPTGQRHKIRVRVARPNLFVQARGSYMR